MHPIGDELFMDWPLMAQMDAIIWAYPPAVGLPPELEIVADKVVQTGPFLDLDAVPEQEAARARLGLAGDEPVVVYAPRGFPFGKEFGHRCWPAVYGAVQASAAGARFPKPRLVLLAVTIRPSCAMWTACRGAAPLGHRPGHPRRQRPWFSRRRPTSWSRKAPAPSTRVPPLARRWSSCPDRFGRSCSWPRPQGAAERPMSRHRQGHCRDPGRRVRYDSGPARPARRNDRSRPRAGHRRWRRDGSSPPRARRGLAPPGNLLGQCGTPAIRVTTIARSPPEAHGQRW